MKYLSMKQEILWKVVTNINTKYVVTEEIYAVWYWNLASLSNVTKEKLSSKSSTKMAWKLNPGPNVCIKNETQALLVNENFWSNQIIGYVIARLLK